MTNSQNEYRQRVISVSLGEKDALKRQMKFFRFHLVDTLNKAIEGKCGTEILNFFLNQEVCNRLMGSKF